MWRFISRNKGRLFLGTFVGVPILGAGSLALYIKYRVRTRPPEVIFKPLVTPEGTLILNDIIIPAPSTLKVFQRVVELFLIFFPVLVQYFVYLLLDNGYHRWLLKLLDAVERAGPAFIKCGQWTCTRQDIFSDDFRAVFQKLYSEVMVHPLEETLRIISEDFKVPADTVFSEIEPATCGSGSIGQVHVARMMGSNEKVVIKVMHPNIVEKISKDFCIINGIASFFSHFKAFERFELKRLALAFTNHLAAQLDFRIEAEHLELFRKHFADVDYVNFPRPIISTMRVLVETWAEGHPATPEFLSAQEEHAREILAGKGLNTFCKMLLRDNFLHGDMHPGNILIDTTDPHKPVVTMIDVGLCQKLTDEEIPVTFNLMSSFVHWKSALCVDTILSMSKTQRFTDREKFSKEMKFLFEHYRPLKDSDSHVVGNILQSIFEVVRDNQVMLDPGYVSLMFAVLVLESFIMSLSPDFNMVRHAAPWLVTEGHLSDKLLKNIILSKGDDLRTNLNIVRCRARDWLTGGAHTSSGVGGSFDSIVVPEGVRVSVA